MRPMVVKPKPTADSQSGIFGLLFARLEEKTILLELMSKYHPNNLFVADDCCSNFQFELSICQYFA